MSGKQDQSVDDSGEQDRERITTTVDPKTKKELKETPGAMGEQIDRLIKDKSEMDFHIVNTNAQYLNDAGTNIYKEGVVVTYGPEKFERKLTDISSGDGIFSYVSKSEVDYSGGFKAFGIARAPYDGIPAEGDERIYPTVGHDREYHVPVTWLAVLPDSQTVTPSEKRRFVGEQPTSTKIKIRDDDLRHGCRLLAELILGRSGYPLTW
ncbi:hypothetical protein [Natrarchaeobius chitinivorans]|uniref:hypothetical protein n=1 Tax=Natrarchaeobius chitinivorans TaxID=1679083 RepID=UPI000F53E362|nr:hypothetical protein [Natrarchaeobius chitinivorans]